jgi:hypothetical protein
MKKNVKNIAYIQNLGGGQTWAQSTLNSFF